MQGTLIIGRLKAYYEHILGEYFRTKRAPTERKWT